MGEKRKADTRERLLEAACRLFSEKGFADTTVAEICRAAGANIAAVNYYFGGKEALYDAVWHYAFRTAEAICPLEDREDGGVEERIFHLARAVLTRTFSDGPEGAFAKLLYREMASPTLALEKIAEEVLEPQVRRLREAIESAFPGADPEAVERCVHSIIGQCVFYNFSRPLRARVMGAETLPPSKIEALARHIARFSAAGISAVLQKQSRTGEETAS